MELSMKVVEDCVLSIESNNKIGALTIAEESVAKNFWEKVKAFERSFYNIEGDEITGAARFFRKDVFEKVDGYDETITGPEDWAITEAVKKSSFLISRVNTLIYHHERITSLFPLLKKKYYYGLKSSVYLQKTQRSLISPKTIYFFRPIFYRNWQRMIVHPILTITMFFMLSLEMIAGELGYLKGKYSE